MGVVVLSCVCATRAQEDFEQRLKQACAAVLDSSRTNEARAEAFLKLGRDVKNDRRMQAALLEQAYAYGLAGVPSESCCDAADEALDLLEEVATDRVQDWRDRRIELHRAWFRKAAGKAKVEAAGTLVDLLLCEAARREAAGQWKEAADLLAEAKPLALILKRRDAEEVAQQYERAKHFAAVYQKVDGLKRILAKQPDDKAARVQLLVALVVDLDQPAEAVNHLDSQVGESWRTYIPAAARPIADLDAQACRELGDWYYKDLLKYAGSPYSKAVVFRRAKQYYERFLGLARQEDALMVRISLGEVTKALEALPAGARSKPVRIGPVAVSARKPWPFSTPVRKGQKLHITATGQWRILPRGKRHGPDDSAFYLGAKIGEGRAFKIGSDFTLEVPEDGTLFLGVCEGGTHANNSGGATVVIEEVK